MTTRFVSLHHRAVLRISGEDAESFLQGLISNDIKKATPEHSIYAALLTPQGKYLFDFIIARQNDGYLFDVERARLSDLIKRLGIYKLRAKVQIEDLSESYRVAALLTEQPHEPGVTKEESGVLVINDPRHPAMAQRVLGPVEKVVAWLAATGATETHPSEYESARLALGIPEGAADFEPERGLLLEHGVEELHGVDFAKGCYVGQEVTARSKHRAELKKGLYLVKASSSLPEPGTPVTAGDKPLGVMRSSQDGLGLALLRHEEVEQAKLGGSAITAGDVPLTHITRQQLV